jgi:putative colanic acid biosynthesis acetyltransferase WcaF
MTEVRLSTYDNSWYYAGRSRAWQAMWYFLGLPLLRCSILPSSSMKVMILRTFGARIGNGCTVKPGIRVKYPWRLTVGNDCWLGEDCWIDNLADVQIGNDVCVSQGAYLCTGNHDWSEPSFSLIIRPIVLRDGAWVGARALLAPGIELGECAVAAAGSVVTQSIPAYQVHAGNPATFIRMRQIRSKSRQAVSVGEE